MQKQWGLAFNLEELHITFELNNIQPILLVWSDFMILVGSPVVLTVIYTVCILHRTTLRYEDK